MSVLTKVFRSWSALAITVGVGASTGVSCGDNLDGGDGIEAYYPELPLPTGDAQVTFAGEITADKTNELLPGPSSTGLVGDYFMKNEVASFVISAPKRYLAVVPTGGNIIDAALLGPDGTPSTPDQFGELSMLYVFGRTCGHDSMEIIYDGSGGGAAVMRAHGRTVNNDFINIRGIGVFNVTPKVDPVRDDGVECATTYILEPGATALQTYFTLYNPTEESIDGPYGTLADSGGEIESWGNGRGFERADISDIASLSEPSPIDYVVYQAPEVAYGLAPRHALDTTENSSFLIAGVSLMLHGNSSLLDILAPEKYFLHMPGKTGNLSHVDFVVGVDSAAIDRVVRGASDVGTDVSGNVAYSAGGAALGARVGVFSDLDNNGVIDDTDTITSYLDVAPDGSFAGTIPSAGNYLLRAEVQNVGRSEAMDAGAGLTLEIPSPVKVDFSVLDDATNLPIPNRILVIGNHPAFPDQRVFSTYDRLTGVVASQHNQFGTSVDVGDGADPALMLPAGGTYRIYASRGTEWSIASQLFVATVDGDIELRLRHVIPTAGYLSTEWHVHQIGSPDSPVANDDRIRSALSAGVELFASTDHDFIIDLQPLVEDMGATKQLRVIAGEEMTPFAYGHFQAWPLVPDPTSPNGGAVDWADGSTPGFSMTPGEIFEAAQDRGAQMVQINHPRSSGLGQFQAYFDRAKVSYDYDSREIFGDFANASIPNSWLRLPDESLWSANFNGLEVWNGFDRADTDGDGIRELQGLDRVTNDYFNMLSLGFTPSPAANSDTHTSTRDPVGMPRTMIRVGDDSSTALESGSVVDAALAVTTGSMPRDIVLTDGPMLSVQVAGNSAIGATVAGTAGSITFNVTIMSPDWASFDTLEVFANATPDKAEVSTLVPLQCFTSRDPLDFDPADPCELASLAAVPLVVALVPAGGGYLRYEATISITLTAAQVAAQVRAGATGTDAWFVFRVRGDRAIFPLMTQDVLSGSGLAALVAGTDPVAIDAALNGRGIPASATAAPVFVDFDGGGYRAPFAQ